MTEAPYMTFSPSSPVVHNGQQQLGGSGCSGGILDKVCTLLALRCFGELGSDVTSGRHQSGQSWSLRSVADTVGATRAVRIFAVKTNSTRQDGGESSRK